MKLVLATKLLFLNLAATTILEEPEKHPRCFDGLYMIFARASGEPPGPGYIGEDLAPKIKKIIPHSGSTAVHYPAAIPVSQYNDSVSHGTQNMIEMVERYVDNCPNHTVALFGYSQGAQVVGDTICGSIETREKTFHKLRPKYERQILAVIQMGDPAFIPGLSWDVGNATHHGEFPRKDANSTCGEYSTRIQSYCDQHDFACASGKSVTVHLSYLFIYQPDVVHFIEKRWSFYQRTGLTSAPSQKMNGSNQGRRILDAKISMTIACALIIVFGTGFS